MQQPQQRTTQGVSSAASDEYRRQVERVCGTVERVCGTVERVCGTVERVCGTVERAVPYKHLRAHETLR